MCWLFSAKRGIKRKVMVSTRQCAITLTWWGSLIASMRLWAILAGAHASGRFNQTGQVTGQGTDITQHLVFQLGVKCGANNIPEKKDLGCQWRLNCTTHKEPRYSKHKTDSTRASIISDNSGQLKEERLLSTRAQTTRRRAGTVEQRWLTFRDGTNSKSKLPPFSFFFLNHGRDIKSEGVFKPLRVPCRKKNAIRTACFF